MIENDPRRQSGIDRYAEESLEKTLNENVDLKFLLHMFSEIKDLISKVFGHWAEIDIKPDHPSMSVIWINKNRKFTFTAELIKEEQRGDVRLNEPDSKVLENEVKKSGY